MSGTLTEQADWRPVRYFEANALLTGGPDCPDNLPLRDLVARDEYLKTALEGHGAAPDPHPQYLTEAEGKQRIDAAVAALVAGAPGTLDTLKELSDALGGDRNFSATVMSLLAGKLGNTETAADAAKLGGQLPGYYAKAEDLQGLCGFKNLLINSNFSINQRGYVSGTPTGTANQYTVDRWRVVVSGQRITWTSDGNTLTVTAPAGGMEQVIEGAAISGGIYRLSWTGTASASVGGTSVSNGEAIALPGGVNVAVKFTVGTVSRPQLEKSLVSTRYEERPPGLELSLCQRYYENGIANWMIQIGSGVTNGNSYCYWSHQIYFKATKRVIPTIIKTTPGANPYVPYVGIMCSTNELTLHNSPNYVGQTPVTQNAFSLTWAADAEI
ncbi:hypothetical protein [Laribacter hongkongensis]|uniref:hypothetical protein n=1 Tax=Laribacter hongkongensis TaxID=168471 RepID=UPI000421D48D|nr:hypothetical protein [Laribacter hongkongensis]